MIRWILIVLFAMPLTVMGQSGPKQYWIQFTDKVNTPYSLSNPLEFLSQRALDRRTAQNIPLMDNDLPIDPAYIQAVLNEGATYLTRSKWLNALSVHVPDSTVLNAILQLPFVAQTQAVGKNDGKNVHTDKWELHPGNKTDLAVETASTDYGLAFNQIDMLGGIPLHQQGFMGQGMLIAVLDAGFPHVDELSIFDSLRNDGRIVGTWDFIAHNDSVFDDHAHGMMVLSTMAAYKPGVMIGTAPLASYLLLHTENGLSEFPIEEDYWVAGAEYADSAGADVINSSLGYTTFDNPIFDHTYADMNGNTTHAAVGADLAASKGILVVCSAGNSGNDPWHYIGSPADGDSVLAIGAVDPSGTIANFSSVGPSSDNDVKPNVCAQGQQAAVIDVNDEVILGNGTSFSGPIMAGMSACLWQMHPEMTNMEVFHTIEESANMYNTPDEYYGYGIPDFSMASILLSGYAPNDLGTDELFPAFPNPFVNQVQGAFYSSRHQSVLIRIVDMLGKEIARFEGMVGDTSVVRFSFDGLDHLDAGIYFLQVEAESGKYLRKLVKPTH